MVSSSSRSVGGVGRGVMSGVGGGCGGASGSTNGAQGNGGGGVGGGVECTSMSDRELFSTGSVSYGSCFAFAGGGGHVDGDALALVLSLGGF